jgi:hypothetical protein
VAVSSGTRFDNLGSVDDEVAAKHYQELFFEIGDVVEAWFR